METGRQYVERSRASVTVAAADISKIQRNRWCAMVNDGRAMHQG